MAIEKYPEIPLEVLEEIQLQFEEYAPRKSRFAAKEQIIHDMFGPGSNPARRYMWQYERIAEQCDALRTLGLPIVLTLGVWDLLHIGHNRYLEMAKACGAVLIVGVDTDSAIRARKGPTRPVVPMVERVEMICHTRHADLVVPIADFDPERGVSGMGTVLAIKPSVFIASARSFGDEHDTDQWLQRVKPHCGEVAILESQATTSSTAKIRELIKILAALINQGIIDAEAAVDLALTEMRESAQQLIAQAIEASSGELKKKLAEAFNTIRQKAEEAERSA